MRRHFVRFVVLAVLVVAALGLSRTAPAQSKVTEVLIGSVLPLTGTFANYGQQYLWSAQTAEDIVNNDYADLQVPLGPGKGFPNFNGAKMKLIVRDSQAVSALPSRPVRQVPPWTPVSSTASSGFAGE